MRVGIIAIGSRGDVQPYVALGKGLQQAGYEVCVLTHDAFEGLVRGRTSGVPGCWWGSS